jgi:hypothetical protein
MSMLSQIACKYRSHAYLHAQSNQLARKFSFPAGSTHTDILSISQTVTVCPDQIYDFYAFALPDPLNTRSCEAWVSTTPGVGAAKAGNKDLLVALSDLSGVWSQFNISEDNTDKTSFSTQALINAYCISSNPSAVYFDTVTVGQT